MTLRPYDPIRLTYIGGPTALLEIGGLRLLTDPTFDPAGTEYPTPLYVLRKTAGPAVPATAIRPIDAVLLSHDHHFDNLDHGGRQMLAQAERVLTTTAGANRLGGNAVGLAVWESRELLTRDGRTLRVTATPARHGPPGGDRGPVIGFMLEPANDAEGSVYISGDTVWYEGVSEVARRFRPELAVLFAGAARVREVGPAHLTMTAADTVAAAQAFSQALIVPLHFEGWAHYSESRTALERAFADAGLAERLRCLLRGETLELMPRV